MDGRKLKALCGLCLLAALLPAQAQEVFYIHTDALGSPVAETDANRNVVARFEYEPYGKRIGTGNDDKPGYTGHVMDAVTGLVQMQQRSYDPGIGVFLSVDPVTAFSNPVGQFHRYRYAANNPYKFMDPDGREPEDKDNRSICNNRKCDSVVDVNPSNGKSEGKGRGAGGVRSANENHIISSAGNIDRSEWSFKAEISNGDEVVVDSPDDIMVETAGTAVGPLPTGQFGYYVNQHPLGENGELAPVHASIEWGKPQWYSSGFVGSSENTTVFSPTAGAGAGGSRWYIKFPNQAAKHGNAANYYIRIYIPASGVR